MKDLINLEQFDFISKEDKDFIISFSEEMKNLGYIYDKEIGPGYCWGRYMIIYRKLGVKSKKVYARIYIRERSIVLRMYFNGIDKHRAYIENSQPYIKNVFIGDYGTCTHCHNEKEGACKFRKAYTIDDLKIEKCNGMTFEFYNPIKKNLNEYIGLFSEFYIKKSKSKN